MDKTLPLVNNNTEPEPFLIKGHILKDRYEVLRVLGNGGFGVTYACRDTTLNLKVAVKEYYPDGFVTRDCKKSPAVTYTASSSAKPYIEKGMHRFLDEARVLARFSGEYGIVDVRDYFEENNTAYIVMEFLDGRDLKELIQEKGRLPAEYAVRLLLPVMESLEKIHRQGLIHRDISPDNIRMVGDKLKLLDFGAARDFSYEGNKTMTVMLKRGYAPIEQYGEVDTQGPWTDVYALCATLYLCITEKKPADALIRWDRDPLQKPSQLGIAISPALENVIMKGLSVAARDRYQSMHELVDALKAALIKAPVHPSSAPVKTNSAPIRTPGSVEQPRPIEAPIPKGQPWQPIPPAPDKPKKNNAKVFIPIISVVLVIAILAGVFVFRDYIFGFDPTDGELIVDSPEDVADQITEPSETPELPLFDLQYDNSEYNPDVERIMEKGELVFSVDAQFAPYAYYGTDKIIGIDIELMQAFADYLGVNLTIEDISFDSLCTSVSSGNADCAGSALTITEEREEYVDFSDTYIVDCPALVVPSEKKQYYEDNYNTGNFTVATSNTTSYWYLSESENLDFRNSYLSQDDAILAMQTSECDGCIISKAKAEAFVKNNPDYEIVATYFAESYAIAFDNDSQLVPVFNEFLKEFKNSANFAEILTKHDLFI